MNHHESMFLVESTVSSTVRMSQLIQLRFHEFIYVVHVGGHHYLPEPILTRQNVLGQLAAFDDDPAVETSLEEP